LICFADPTIRSLSMTTLLSVRFGVDDLVDHICSEVAVTGSGTTYRHT
jgi:hypothetical protein